MLIQRKEEWQIDYWQGPQVCNTLRVFSIFINVHLQFGHLTMVWQNLVLILVSTTLQITLLSHFGYRSLCLEPGNRECSYLSYSPTHSDAHSVQNLWLHISCHTKFCRQPHWNLAIAVRKLATNRWTKHLGTTTWTK